MISPTSIPGLAAPNLLEPSFLPPAAAVATPPPVLLPGLSTPHSTAGQVNPTSRSATDAR